jgi:hypothetical protein
MPRESIEKCTVSSMVATPMIVAPEYDVPGIAQPLSASCAPRPHTVFGISYFYTPWPDKCLIECGTRSRAERRQVVVNLKFNAQRQYVVRAS